MVETRRVADEIRRRRGLRTETRTRRWPRWRTRTRWARDSRRRRASESTQDYTVAARDIAVGAYSPRAHGLAHDLEGRGLAASPTKLSQRPKGAAPASVVHPR